MLVKKTDIYFHKFSQIFGLQNEELVKYKLCKTEEKDLITYGIELVSLTKSGSEECEKDTLERISCSKEIVLDILKYLYENSVRPKFARGIITDILNAKKILNESVLALS